jgi:alginate O-acetyltransferase complex protein AlgI
MGAETRSSVATKPRRALHQQYLPWPRKGQKHEAREDTGLYPGEPETCRRSLRPFVRNFLYLALLLAVFQVYRIEERPFQGRAFQMLVTLALAALPLHYLAPFRWKKPLFLAVSIGGLWWIFGTQVAAVVLGTSAILIGTCFLPIPWLMRAGVIATFALVLACTRSALPRTLIPDNVLPVVASMFMFRMMIYLYELKHAKTREKLVDTLSYFFLLPNYCFMHFPVVDYRTMQRGYFADDVHILQGRGLQMMFRGTIHLLLYRLVYHEMLIPAARVHDLASLACYLVCNYLLYLQVSGQFHIACGMLHLYGFQLPETHHNYLLATGFTDYWRRINIYWKDFMVRLFFNPVVFRLKRWPQPLALAVATLTVFMATWLLHAYQSFWLRGTWGFSVPDSLFWGILGVMVLVNVQLDARRSATAGRSSCRGAHRPGFHELALRSVKVAATFSTIAILWSLWSSPSLSAWLEMIGRGFHGSRGL